MSHIYSVTQLNQQIKNLLESNPVFRNVFVQGEISNYKQHTSGHHYMTLKDAGGAIGAVLFRADAMRLRFRLENGMKVIARGRISSFPKTGQVQMYLADLMPDGAGALHMAFEQLKQKLYIEGLFDEQHKRQLPEMPQTIALVTSPTGAAVRDMIRILGRRYPLAQVEVWPVLVQGENAAQSIAQTLERVNLHSKADVIITGRGGGSLEDLWAFNEEIVARAIYNSRIPVISAVGHEPDVTITDFVADLRASTPSAAAELAVPDQAELRMTVDRAQMRLTTALQNRMKRESMYLDGLYNRLRQRTPAYYLADKRQQILQLETRLQQAQKHRMERAQTVLGAQTQRLHTGIHRQQERLRSRFTACAGRLDALSPLRVLSRGFSVVTNADNQVVTNSESLNTGDKVTLRFAQGTAQACIQTVQKSRKEHHAKKTNI